MIKDAIDKLSTVQGSLGAMRNRLEAGTRVRHKVFGLGTILSVDVDRGFYNIKFDSLETERHLMISAPLEVVVS